MAMVNYPYPADFEGQIPGWPVTVACGYYTALSDKATDEEIWAASSLAADVQFNYQNYKKEKCLQLEPAPKSEEAEEDEEVVFGAGIEGWLVMACKT